MQKQRYQERLGTRRLTAGLEYGNFHMLSSSASLEWPGGKVKPLAIRLSGAGSADEHPLARLPRKPDRDLASAGRALGFGA